jgi:spermidine/putrescine transport system permease protein
VVGQLVEGPVTAQLPRRARRNYTPYLLLLPGMAWLVVFFVVPMLALFSQSLQTGSVETGYVMTWNFQTYVDALSQFWPHFVRSLLFAGTATLFASWRRSQAGGRTSCWCWSSRPSSPAS